MPPFDTIGSVTGMTVLYDRPGMAPLGGAFTFGSDVCPPGGIGNGSVWPKPNDNVFR